MKENLCPLLGHEAQCGDFCAWYRPGRAGAGQCAITEAAQDLRGIRTSLYIVSDCLDSITDDDGLAISGAVDVYGPEADQDPAQAADLAADPSADPEGRPDAGSD